MIRRYHLISYISTGLLLVLWAVGAAVIKESFLLPSPAAVASDLARLIAEDWFPSTIAASSARSAAAFGIAALLSFAIGIPEGLSAGARSFTRPWMAVIKATPVVSFILIALLWFGSSFVPVFVAVLMILPVMTEAVYRGMSETDANLLAMARVYRLSRLETLRYIRLPSVLPFFLAGAGSSLGLSWKVVVAAEILGLPRLGIGSAMQYAKTHLETERVFSLTVAAIILSVLAEGFFFFLASIASRRMGKGDVPS